jgi:hypothetical protein
MKKIALAVFAFAAVSSTCALADSRHMFCYGGGRAALYYSAIFPVAQGVKSAEKEKAFDAFIKAKYGTVIFAGCYGDGSQADSQSNKKIREDSDQKSQFPSKLIETGWTGK